MPQVHHMVLLKFKQDVNDATIAEVLQAVEELKQSIPGIVYCSSGAYSSPEGLNKGFTHGFLTIFESAAARDRYLPHPKHEIVKNTLFAILEDAVAFDFVAGCSTE
jgi:Stress responsive A/B Barrel Domain